MCRKAQESYLEAHRDMIEQLGNKGVSFRLSRVVTGVESPVEGYGLTKRGALAIAHQFQTSLDDLLKNEFPGMLELSLCQATCGDVEDQDG